MDIIKNVFNNILSDTSHSGVSEEERGNLPLKSVLMKELEPFVLESEVNAMSLIVNESYPKALIPIFTLIGSKDHNVLHDHLSVILCKMNKRRQFLTNWKLKRFLVDVNYILHVLGYEKLRFWDRSVRVSTKATYVVQKMGLECKARSCIYTSQKSDDFLCKALNTIDSESCQPGKTEKDLDDGAKVKKFLLKRREKLMSLLKEGTMKKGLEISSHVDPSYIPFENQVSRRVDVSLEETLQNFVDNPPIPELDENPIMDEEVRKKCLDRTDEIGLWMGIKSYKDALLTQLSDKLSKEASKIFCLNKLVQNPSLADEANEGRLWSKKDHEGAAYSDPHSMNMDDIIRLGGVELYGESVLMFNKEKEKIKNDREKFLSNNKRNYKLHRETVLRENWAEDSHQKMKCLRSVNIFKVFLEEMKMSDYEKIILEENVVKSSYFKNESMRRAMIDLKNKSCHYSKFRMDRKRAQRERSVLDDFYGTKSLSNKRDKYYDFKDRPKRKCPDISKRESIVVFKDLEVILKKYFKINDNFHFESKIDEAFDVIPYRRFTKNGTEIRTIPDINYKVVLGRRKINHAFEGVNKKRDRKYIGLERARTKLESWFEGKVKMRERYLSKLPEMKLNEEKDIKEEMENWSSLLSSESTERSKARNYPKVNMEFYGKLREAVEIRGKIIVLEGDFLNYINTTLRQRWITNHLEQREFSLRERIRLAEFIDEYNRRLREIKLALPDEEIAINMREIANKFVKFSEYDKIEEYNLEVRMHDYAKLVIDGKIENIQAIVFERQKREAEERISAVRLDPKDKKEIRKKISGMKEILSRIDEKYDRLESEVKGRQISLLKNKKKLFLPVYEEELRIFKRMKEEKSKSENKFKKAYFEAMKYQRGKIEEENYFYQERFNEQFFRENVEGSLTMLFRGLEPDKSRKFWEERYKEEENNLIKGLWKNRLKRNRKRENELEERMKMRRSKMNDSFK